MPKKKKTEEVQTGMNGKEFMDALNDIIKDKHIDENIIWDAVEQGLISAYKKNYDSKTNVKVKVNHETGEFKVYRYYVVVEDYIEGDEVTDEEGNVTYAEPEINEDAQILLEDAKEKWPDAKVGDEYEEEVIPADFGRVAASTCYYVDLGRTRALLPKSEIIPGEKLVMGSQIKVYISKVENNGKGPLILCSRKHFNFIKRLFESTIPEFKDGTLEIHGVAREAGVRSKVSVASTNERIDPIGTCIGEKGTRIASILKELNGEKVDLVLYSEDPAEYIKNALAPAKNAIVTITENDKNHEALAIVPDDELSLAIGKKGINIKLASILTKFKINIKSMSQVQEEGNRE